jgi:hypothetical protein
MARAGRRWKWPNNTVYALVHTRRRTGAFTEAVTSGGGGGEGIAR